MFESHSDARHRDAIRAAHVERGRVVAEFFRFLGFGRQG